MSARVRWLVCAFLLVACGDSGKSGEGTFNNPDGNGGTGCATCGAYGKIVGALCDLHARCPDEAYPVAYRSRSECMDIFAFLLTCHVEDNEVDDVHDYYLVQNIPKIDEARADACVAWLQTADCRLLGGALDDDSSSSSGDEKPETPCDGLIASDDLEDSVDPYYRAEGESCEDRSCQDGLYCPIPTLTSDGNAQCATCTRLPAIGEPCAEGFEPCVEGAFCDPFSEPRMCTAKFAAGVACQGDGFCQSDFCHSINAVCVDGGRIGDGCADNTDCRENFCDAGKCANRRAQGSACTLPEQCANGICEAGHCGASNGVACTYDSQCAGRCDETTSLCADAAPEGSSCQYDEDCTTHACDPFAHICKRECFGNDQCNTGEYCNWSDNSCYPVAPDGSGCRDDEGCQSGYCGFDEVCKTRPKIGDACSASYECYPLGTCKDQKCVKRKNANEACEQLDDCLEPLLCQNNRCTMMPLECRPAQNGKMCTWLRVCQENSYCDITAGFICKPKKQSGAECLRAEDCAAGLRCKVNAEQTAQTCQPLGVAGEACQDQGECAEGLYCIRIDFESTCQAGPVGQPCNRYSDEGAPCPTGYWCDDYDQCQALGKEGDRCRYNEPTCEAGLYCPSSTCAKLAALGETCSSSVRSCQDGLVCSGDDYKCVAANDLDEECDTWPEDSCVKGLTCTWQETDGVSRCKPGLENGADCYDDEQCASRICDDDVGCVASAQCVMP